VARGEGALDRRNIARMYVPGIFFMETLFSPAGSGAEKGNLAGAKQYRNCQFFTPETSRTTHFFWDYLHDYALDDPNVSLSLYHSMVAGFNEDKAIIEAQQKTLEADPSFQMNAIVADAPLTHFRRTLARMIEQERAALKAVA
jgi:vanillate O-demethylase monooxygenase subunit